MAWFEELADGSLVEVAEALVKQEMENYFADNAKAMMRFMRSGVLNGIDVNGHLYYWIWDVKPKMG